MRNAVGDSPIGGFIDTAGQLINDISDTAHIAVQRVVELTYSAILRSTSYIKLTLILASSLIGLRAEDV